MAHLPIAIARLRHDLEPSSPDVPVEWRTAGIDQRIGRSLFCEGLRDHFPRPTPQRAGRPCPRSLPDHAPRTGLPHPRLYLTGVVPHEIPATAQSCNPTTERP